MYLHYDNEYDFYLIFLRGVRVKSRLLRMVGKVDGVSRFYGTAS